MTQTNFHFYDDTSPPDGIPASTSHTSQRDRRKSTPGRRPNGAPWRCPTCGGKLLATATTCLACKVLREKGRRLL
jgi:hypothetical protein